MIHTRQRTAKGKALRAALIAQFAKERAEMEAAGQVSPGSEAPKQQPQQNKQQQPQRK